jgi:hypothetical protein
MKYPLEIVTAAISPAAEVCLSQLPVQEKNGRRELPQN